ncbi:MAG: tyrosine-type recombinase/integrase [SAR324 cluster bacterium]|nr:tyrosine-type recombinase/integrase [SAR324 cluster bacterium]
MPHLTKFDLVHPELKDLLVSFFGKKAATTQRAYAQDLEDFRKYQGTEKLEDALSDFFGSPASRASLKVQHYKFLMGERGLKSTSINRRISMLKTLTKNARNKGLVAWHLEVERDIEGAIAKPIATDLKAVAALAAYFEDLPDKPIHQRNRALLYLIQDLALKSSEICDLTFANLSLSKKTLTVGKEKKNLPKRLGQALSLWVAVRGFGAGPLFTNFDHSQKSGQGLSTTSIYRIIKGLGKEIGVELNPRSLRQGAIAHKLETKKSGLASLMSFSGLTHEKSLKRYQK